MLLLLASLCVIGALVYYVTRPVRERGRLPPGPVAIPVLGNILRFRGSKRSVFEEVVDLAKEYGDGDCVTIWMGLEPTVFLNSYDGIRRALIDRPLEFASRPEVPLFDFLFEGNVDIVFGKLNPEWAAMKKFGIRLVRTVMDSGRLERNVVEATDRVLKDFAAQDLSKPADMLIPMNNIVYNIILALCFGVQYASDDPRFLEIVQLRQTFNDAPWYFFMLNAIPGIARLDPLLDKFPFYNKVKMSGVKQLEIVKDFLKEHRAKMAEKKRNVEEMDDILYAALQEQEKGDAEYELTDSKIVVIVLDIFAAGIETTSTTIRWFLNDMAANADIQEECAQSVRNLIGNGIPTLEDRAQLPLMEAALLETLRLHPPAPTAVPRSPSQPGAKFLDKYDLPEDASIQYNLYGAMRDPAVFDDPNTYNPRRFVEGDKCLKPNSWIPFGVGRRVCMGEQLAKNDLFLIACTLLQRARFFAPPDGTFTLEHELAAGLTNLPKSKELMVELRD